LFKFWSFLTQKNFIKGKLLEILKYDLNVKAQQLMSLQKVRETTQK